MESHPGQDVKTALPCYVHVAGEVHVLNYLTRGVQRADAAEVICARNGRWVRWRRRRSRGRVVLVEEIGIKITIVGIVVCGRENEDRVREGYKGEEKKEMRNMRAKSSHSLVEKVIRMEGLGSFHE